MRCVAYLHVVNFYLLSIELVDSVVVGTTRGCKHEYSESVSIVVVGASARSDLIVGKILLRTNLLEEPVNEGFSEAAWRVDGEALKHPQLLLCEHTVPINVKLKIVVVHAPRAVWREPALTETEVCGVVVFVAKQREHRLLTHGADFEECGSDGRVAQTVEVDATCAYINVMGERA